MARKIESPEIAGPAGRLEALLEEPDRDPPLYAALVCHPHPEHGGTMHNKVVYRIARGLRAAGAVVLRFNYRGVNRSEGSYDDGHGETLDAHAALDHLRARYPDLPFVLSGFSFGSRIALRLAVELPDAARCIAVGYPAAKDHLFPLEPCRVPRHFIHSTNDEFGSVEQLQALLATLSGPPTVDFIPAQDHFFAGALDEFEAAVKRAGALGA